MSLFGTIVAADVFVLGFLLAGTLADYKEGERLPSDLASSIESMADEFLITVAAHPGAGARAGLSAVAHLATGVRRWLYREVETPEVMAQITGLNEHLRAMEPMSQPQFVARLKQEQALTRKMIMRIETIRDTQFVVAGYAMAELGTAAVIAGFLFLEISSGTQAALFTGIVSFLLIYLVMLIHDLDNPFDHYKSHPEAARVSLHAIHDVEQRLQGYVADQEVATPASVAAG